MNSPRLLFYRYKESKRGRLTPNLALGGDIVGHYYTIDDVTNRVLLSKDIRVTLANLRKQGLSAGDIGNAGLAAGENPQAVRAMVAYASRIRNVERVNACWGAA